MALWFKTYPTKQLMISDKLVYNIFYCNIARLSSTDAFWSEPKLSTAWSYAMHGPVYF
jgi:hypothetical protein